MPPFNSVVRLAAIAAVFAALSGCSEYLDRRDTLVRSGGNAVATNQATQMVDPWPRASADNDITYNGDKMASAFERYRTNNVIPPKGTGTSQTYQQQSNQAPVGPSVTSSQPAPAK
jgi:hypothetical protein